MAEPKKKKDKKGIEPGSVDISVSIDAENNTGVAVSTLPDQQQEGPPDTPGAVIPE